MCSACCLCSVLTMDGGACKKKKNTHRPQVQTDRAQFFTVQNIVKLSSQTLKRDLIQVYICDLKDGVWWNIIKSMSDENGWQTCTHHATDPDRNILSYALKCACVQCKHCTCDIHLQILLPTSTTEKKGFTQFCVFLEIFSKIMGFTKMQVQLHNLME